MNGARPDPLVSAETDLREFDFMPLFGDRLFKSETWILCDDAERVAALRLWWASWHEEPAGSLPANDRLLADLAGYGVAVKQFLGVKQNAMRGWIECSDGRLYHPVVCQIAADTFTKKRKRAADSAAERERKRRKRAACPPDKPPMSTGHVTGHPPENALKGERREEDSPSLRSGEPADEREPDLLADKTTTNGAKRERRKSRISETWQPDERDRAYAETKGFGAEWLAQQAERFRDHHLRAGSLFADWNAAWRTWVQRAPEFARGPEAGRAGTDRQSPGGVVAALGRF